MTSTASANAFAWRRPFWPVVESIVIRVSCGAPASRFEITRRTLVSSSIRLPWVWRRPAVSMMTTSMPRASAAEIASKTTAPASPPSVLLTISQPARSAQVSSCSTAAAR